MPAPGLLLLVDLDGVLYRGLEPVPGIAAVLAARAARGDDVVYVTNNSMWYRADYVERIAQMVDEADTAQEVLVESAAPGLDLICRGLRLVSPDDRVAFERGRLIYDALYAQLTADPAS